MKIGCTPKTSILDLLNLYQQCTNTSLPHSIANLFPTIGGTHREIRRNVTAHIFVFQHCFWVEICPARQAVHRVNLGSSSLTNKVWNNEKQHTYNYMKHNIFFFFYETSGALRENNWQAAGKTKRLLTPRVGGSISCPPLNPRLHQVQQTLRHIAFTQ